MSKSNIIPFKSPGLEVKMFKLKKPVTIHSILNAIINDEIRDCYISEIADKTDSYYTETGKDRPLNG